MDVKDIYAALPYCLDDIAIEGLGKKYSGKVRDCYVLHAGSADAKRILITSDRLSCFDRVVTTVPFKGQVLTSLAMFWFDKVASIIPHHVLGRPHPNVMVGREASVIPLEIVVRAYLTGSAWRDYEAGRPVSGTILPKGMRKDQRFDAPILTPSTKAEVGEHDMPISESEILHREIVSEVLWYKIKTAALALFQEGSRWAKERGLLLVDTKYEFGLCNGELILVDEIHTLDSSRYWIESEYESRFEQQVDQIMLDKEPTRQWLLSQGFKGDGPIPTFTDEHRVQLAQHYIDSYEKITGLSFQGQGRTTPDAIKKSIEPYLLEDC
jgi:phosphoribosylaminoimidazole-succinocarboxamide synthase